MVEDGIIFLGSGGARVVVSIQQRVTGGILFYLAETLILVDPGPGSLIRFHQHGRPYRIDKLDAIILTHRHIDHTADANIIIDAMTEGGKKRKGILFAPADSLDNDPVVLRYHQSFLNEIKVINTGLEYRFDDLRLQFPIRHHHGVESYGVKFIHPEYSIGYITDTDYFDKLKEVYQCDILIINVLRPEPINFPHLSVMDAKKIIESTSPKLTIITHFGMMMITKGPSRIARNLSRQTNARIIAAEDGMRIKPGDFLNGQDQASA
ncbi:MAG TPA: MBL fold metallo-hydrolase [bacterium (Candidatus Stahlbacteria)]|nr:MBL fold metallo-hydrolase [Candidatus Stahlbacteria bacterium]